ncbi:type II secretion system major pseudopilin GspG [Candidatus Babeliales bacterium]|nr:type II secretion system major pseudopilin GspG [Candidatus Babeliales bacterium]
MQIHSRPKHVKSGFTLIEIIIAIAIMSFMMAVVAPGVYKWLGFGKVRQTEANVKVLQTSILHFNLDTNGYPQRLEDLVRRPSDERLSAKWRGPYVEGSNIPDDGWGEPFVYRVKPGAQPPYELYSYGENGPDAPREEWIGVKH